MANFKFMNVSGKRTAINLDQIVYAEIDGSTVHLVSPSGNTTDVQVEPGASVEDVWSFLFPESQNRTQQR